MYHASVFPWLRIHLNRRWMIHYWYVTNTLMIHVSQTPVDSPLKWPVDTCIVMYQQCIRTVSHWMSPTTVGDVTHQIWAIVSMTWYICDTIPNTLNNTCIKHTRGQENCRQSIQLWHWFDTCAIHCIMVSRHLGTSDTLYCNVSWVYCDCDLSTRSVTW